MPFKFLGKTVFAMALIASGAMYILAQTAWEGLDEAVYMNPFLLMTVYVFYVLLIMPFNIGYALAASRAYSLVKYELRFLAGLTLAAVLYELALTVEIGILGIFIRDSFLFSRVINYSVFLFMNLNAFNFFYTALCSKISFTAARIITFSLPCVGCLLNHFAKDAVSKFNFLYFGMRGASALNAAIVYITVFGGCSLLLLKKGKREYA